MSEAHGSHSTPPRGPERGTRAMELTLLTVPGCPHATAFEERLAAALAGYPGAVLHRRVIATAREAAAAGMHGSPTLLVDGADPFARPGEAASLSCRLYPGGAGGLPSVASLRDALSQR
jgi:hypothetical protein